MRSTQIEVVNKVLDYLETAKNDIHEAVFVLDSNTSAAKVELELALIDIQVAQAYLREMKKH